MGKQQILKVAWLSILLGVGMELILLAVAVGMGKMPGLKSIVADVVQKVSWSLLVCIGLAFGAAAAKAREAVMGLSGLLAAPAAFHVARALHKGTLQALGDVAASAAASPAPGVMALIRMVEYAWLGTILGWLGKRSAGGALYAVVGLATGLVCAGLIVRLAFSGAAQPSTAALISKAINEILFPMGCSLVLFAAEAAGRRGTIRSRD